MTFTAPLGLFGLLLVPLVVGMHLFRRRLPERRVAALFLFPVARLTAGAGRTRTTLLRTPSFWCEVLAALLLGLWLGGPVFGGGAQRHVVFVLDDSASMGAGAAARARDALLERARALSSTDRVTVLRTGPRPTVALGPKALPGELAGALAAWAPARPRHDLLATLDLARELASGGGEVLFATDETPAVDCADIGVLGFGRPAPNCAILTTLRAPRADGPGERLRVRLGAYGGAAATTLVVVADGREVLRREVAFADGVADLAVDLPAGLDALELRLAADGLAVDDAAWLLPPADRTVGVCDLLPAERRQQLELDRVFVALRGHRRETDAARAQLVLAERPGQLVTGQTEIVIAPGDGERSAWRGPFVVDRGHPWLAGVRLQGVVWVAGVRSLPGHVLVAVGNQPLLCEEFLDQGRRLWIDLDPSRGNVPRAPDWPLLLANVLEACRAEVPGPERTDLVLGDEARFRRSLRAGAPDAEVRLRQPDGKELPGHGGRTVAWVVEQPGIHTVLGADGSPLGRFAARFHDPAESDLRTLRTFESPAAAPPAPAAAAAARDDDGLGRWLLAALLAALLLDWWWLQRRAG